MIELMTVITIIVVMLAVAVPVVRSIQGDRTVEVGYNTIAAALGHARQIALYYRAPAGLAFYKDPITGYQDIAVVTQEKNIPQDMANATIAASPDDRYMDLIPGEHIITLPQGLAVQVFNGNNAPLAGATPPYEKYLRVGIVLFNEDGQLATTPYWVRIMGASAPPGHLGDMTHLNLQKSLNPTGNPPTLYSHPAVCLYDEESYFGQTAASGGPFNDANDNTANYGGFFVTSSPTPNPPLDKPGQQTWLDQNGEVLVIKPNDGSLLRNK